MTRTVCIPRTRILGTGRYVPQKVVTNAELEAQVDTTDGWIRQHTGIERRHVAAPGEVTSDMAAAAGKAAIEAAGLTVADLDMIILATTSGDAPMPTTAVHVQPKLGAALIPSFDLAASYAGFLYAMTVADQFIATMRTQRHQGTGRPVLPPMPAAMFANLHDEDLSSMFAYLQSLPPVKNRVPQPIDPPENTQQQ